MISRSILERVFKLQVGNMFGTGFIVENNNQKLLVTAKHLFENEEFPSKTTIQIKKGNSFIKIDNQIKYSNKSDVAVIKTSYFDSFHFKKINYTKKEIFLSQEVFMLGFPYGCEMNYYNLNNDFPLPLVKHGIISGFIDDNELWIDWDNNEGFSGGPVVYRKLSDTGYSDEEYIGGIICRYITHRIGADEELSENSGIGIAIDIQDALNVAKEFM